MGRVSIKTDFCLDHFSDCTDIESKSKEKFDSDSNCCDSDIEYFRTEMSIKDLIGNNIAAGNDQEIVASISSKLKLGVNEVQKTIKEPSRKCSKNMKDKKGTSEQKSKKIKDKSSKCNNIPKEQLVSIKTGFKQDETAKVMHQKLCEEILQRGTITR